MDDLDLRLLSELDKDCRATLSHLGKALRLSKAAVAKRIERLEREEAIKGYYAVVDASRLGYLSFRVYLKFNKSTPAVEQRLVEDLVGDRRVWWVGSIHGSWDLGFVIWVKDVYEFRNCWLQLLLKYRQYVGRYEVTPYTKLSHFSLNFLGDKLGEKKRVGIQGEGPRVGIDEKDARILRVLSAHARWPVSRIALETKLTPVVVAYRMRQLQRNGVLQAFRPAIDTVRLGYSLYKLDLFLEDWKKLGDVNAFLQSIPNLAFIDETVGGADVEADLYFRNAKELEDLLAMLKRRFSAVLREYRYFTYGNVQKYAHFPG